jgi:hypothetical protein
MACITQFAPAWAMAATQVARVARVEELATQQLECASERAPLRMNWVAVTDIGGNQRLQMRWTLSADDR